MASISDLDLTTPSDETSSNLEEHWYSINQTRRRELSWKRITSSSKRISFLLTSEPRCMNQMCNVQLRYNGTISNRFSGCLSFSLETRGQPGRMSKKKKVYEE